MHGKRDESVAHFLPCGPSDVRHQKGTFEVAFAEHEKRFKENIEKVQKRRADVRQGANLSGQHIKDG